MASDGVDTLRTMQNFAARNRALAGDDDVVGEGAASGGEEVMGVDVSGGDAADAGLVVKASRTRKHRPKLIPTHLMQENGLVEVYEEFPLLRFSEEHGAEAANLRKLIRQYRQWARGVFPQRCLEDFVEEVRGFAPTIKDHLDVMRNIEATRRSGVDVDKLELRYDARQRREQMPSIKPPEELSGEAAPGGDGERNEADAGAAGGGAGPAPAPIFAPPTAKPAAPVRDVPAWDDDGLGDDDLEMMEALEAQIAARQAQAAT